MSSYTVVTIETDSKSRFDLAIPLNMPNQVLASALVQALGLADNGKGIHLLSVKTPDGIIRLSPDVTLSEAGVLDGFILQLQQREVKNLPRGDAEARVFLQAESGEMFRLNTVPAVIGRKDVKRGVLVDIDLAPHDTRKLISRRHASIEKRGDRFVVIDLGSTNGTMVNGKKLISRGEHMLENGDMLEFGRDGVRLRFVSTS